MVSVLSSTKTPRVLIGRIGSNGPFNRIAEGLRNSGYRVTEWESSRIGVHSTEQDVRDQVKDIDVAFLVIRAEDANDRGGAIRPLQRILVQAGLMQGKMRMDRVILLVEESVRGLSADTGLSIIRFTPGDPELVLGAVIDKIDELFPEEPDEWVAEPTSRIANLPPPPEHRSTTTTSTKAVRAEPRVLVGDDEQSDALKVALRLVLLVVLAALFSVLLAFLLAGRNGQDDGAEDADGVEDTEQEAEEPDATTQTTQSVAGEEASTGEVQADSGIQFPSAPDGAEEILESLGVGRPAVDSPAAPETLDDDSGLSLPAICQVNLRKGSLFDNAIRCDGAGQIEISGFEGPWHNETAAVVMGEGVVGTLEYELRDNGSTDGPSVIELPVGTSVLNESDARFGIGTLLLRFSAEGQHVHLFGRSDAGGREVTLRFSLDG